METGDFFKRVDEVFHDWKYDHPRVLYALIRSLKPLVVVEVVFAARRIRAALPVEAISQKMEGVERVRYEVGNVRDGRVIHCDSYGSRFVSIPSSLAARARA